ncbi:MAG: ferritin family protein [Burkholderiales bacterium]|nr:ferritin family protein [Burkholderiales bacterium]
MSDPDNDADKPAAATVKAPQTLEDFMAQALAMEREAVERYTDFADAMQAHNNPEVAALFRTMAGYEAKHAEQIKAQMGWREDPVVPRQSVAWTGFDAPEAAPIDEVHYLMQPWHALQLALAAERRAEAFFAELARLATSEPVRRAALELQAEEAEHAALVQAWLAKVPQPDPNWAEDPDPPRYTD